MKRKYTYSSRKENSKGVEITFEYQDYDPTFIEKLFGTPLYNGKISVFYPLSDNGVHFTTDLAFTKTGEKVPYGLKDQLLSLYNIAKMKEEEENKTA